MLLSDVLLFMTDPIRVRLVRLLLRPLTSNFPPEFFLLNPGPIPEPRLLGKPSRLGDIGGCGCPRGAPH